MTAETWGIKLVLLFWKHVIKMWDLRNDGEKALLAQKNTTKARDILICKGLPVIENIHELSHQDRDWATKTPEEVQKMTEIGLTTWLKKVKELKQIAQKEVLTNQRLIEVMVRNTNINS